MEVGKRCGRHRPASAGTALLRAASFLTDGLFLPSCTSSLLSIVSLPTKIDIMTEIEKQLRSILYRDRDGSWVADYKRIRVVATKKIT